MMFGVVEGAVLIGVAHPTIGLYQAHLGRPGDWLGIFPPSCYGTRSEPFGRQLIS